MRRIILSQAWVDPHGKVEARILQEWFWGADWRQFLAVTVGPEGGVYVGFDRPVYVRSEREVLNDLCGCLDRECPDRAKRESLSIPL